MTTPASPALLLAEPKFVLRRTLMYALHDMGLAEVSEAASIDVAHHHAATERYAMLLLDLDPQQRALDLVDRLRTGDCASPADTPVLLMSADCHPVTEARAQALAPLPILRKPVRVRDLIKRIEASMEREGARA